jgi:serine/threonine protein kinase
VSTQPREDGPVRIGPYTLLAKIGEGGMGVVHLARREDSTTRVALKVLRPHVVGDDEARQRLAREVSSLGRIRSRWVAEIVDADPWAEIPYVATRYVPGLSLHDHVVQEGPVEGPDLLWFAGALAEGLASVHGVGVLHRDVKPSNVLMEGRTPILIDFGLARVADDPRLTHTGWLLGTPGYLAPEILYGDDASPASDLHSWAATVAYAAVGRAPFGGGPAMAIMDRVRRGEHSLDGLTGPLREVVVAALDPEPSRRPTLDAVLAWLRPQTTAPSPLLAAPPAALPAEPPTAPLHSLPADPDDDLFGDSLALAATAHEPPSPTVPPAPPAPPAPAPATLVLTDDRLQRPTALERSEPPPPPRPQPQPVLRSAPGPVPVHPFPRQLQPVQPAPFPYGWPEPPPPVPLGERLRRHALVVGGVLVTAATTAAAPWVTLTVVVLAVWLLRSGSLAASAAGRRRTRRGERWYDAVVLVVAAPWHLVQALPGAALLLAWAGGLGVAVGLVCYAVAASLTVSLALVGLAVALALWWGPGGDRLRGPLNHLVEPAAGRVGWWAGFLVALLVVAAGTGAWVEASGTDWAPAVDRPFAGR